MTNIKSVKKTLDKVFNKIDTYGMLDNTDKVFVATSGGADSMALLAFFNEYKEEFEIEVVAVHVNHGMREITADRDADFVRAYCSKNNIKCIVFDASRDGTEIPEHASENWARQLRYGYLNSLCEVGVKIATAHTLSDQLETAIFRLARGGSGLNGMSCIPAIRDYYIRPFIDITRDEVEELVEFFGTGNITDESNLTDDYSRNKIRHHVIPVLKEINPKAEESVGKFCDRVNKAYNLVSDMADFQYDRAVVIPGRKYKTSEVIHNYDIITEEVVSKILDRVGFLNEVTVDFVVKALNKAKTENAVEEKSYGDILVDDNTRICVTNHFITIQTSVEGFSRSIESFVNSYRDGNQFGYTFEYEVINQKTFQNNCNSKFDLCHYMDLDLIGTSELTVEYKKQGDKFTPACKTGGKVSKFMKGVPINEKDYVPMIKLNGLTIWVWGVGFTNGFTPNSESNRILFIKSLKRF